MHVIIFTVFTDSGYNITKFSLAMGTNLIIM